MPVSQIRNFTIIFFILLAGDIYSYSVSDFNSEKSKILNLENSLVKDSICTYITVKKSQPIMSMEEETVYSLDLSYGSSVTPLFRQQLSPDDYKLFGNFKKIYPSNGETIQTLNAGLNFSLPYNLITTFNFAFLPAIQFDGAERGNIKANANLYYRILYEKFTFVGLFAGGGYTYTSGSIHKNLDLYYSDSVNSVSYKGNLNTDWNYNALNAELFIHKLFFVVNFYGRANYYTLFGETKSELSGDMSLTGKMDEKASDNTFGQGFVLSGGMEIVLGWVKLNVEAGRDWLTSSVYGNFGIRIGM